MLRNSLRFLLVVTLALTFLTPALAAKINSPAPDFDLKDLAGTKMTLSSQKGKVVILNFWSTTCSPCVAEIPSLNELNRELKGNGLVVLGIALDPDATPVRNLAASQKLGYTILMDSNHDVYFDTYGLFGQPVSIIIDRHGIIRERLMGKVEWTSLQVKTRIQSYLKER